MKLYFARHGQTDSNASVLTDAKKKSVDDEGLNSTGIQQAATLAEQLKDVHFDIILTSTLPRAIQTAEAVNHFHNLPITRVEAWREIRTDRYVDGDVWNALFTFDTPTATENIEPLTAFFDRIYRELDNLVAHHPSSTVLVVSHGGVHQPVYAYANKLPLQGNIRLAPLLNCEYRIYDL